jgi:hypothetical protein
MKKNDFSLDVHDFFCMRFFSFFRTTLPIILNFFHYFLFLSATAPKRIFTSQKMKEVKKK